MAGDCPLPEFNEGPLTGKLMFKHDESTAIQELSRTLMIQIEHSRVTDATFFRSPRIAHRDQFVVERLRYIDALTFGRIPADESLRPR